MAKKRVAVIADLRATSRTNRKSPSDQTTDSRMCDWADAGLWACLFCVTLFAYAPSLQGRLLWDDTSHITRAELQSLHGLWRIGFDLGATQQYYPFLHSAFWIEHRIWGDAVAGYHLANV